MRLPDLVVDLQQLESIRVEKLADHDAIASLDSPYAESLLAKFARYYGRLGTPDIDKEIVLERLRAKSAASGHVGEPTSIWLMMRENGGAPTALDRRPIR
jgi:hypothetical protein